MRTLLIAVLCIVFAACKSDEEKKLAASVSQELTLSADDKIANAEAGVVEQYKEQELQLNNDYVKRLKEQPQKSFEKQLEVFEDNELGVMKSYANMFRYFLKSKEQWDDDLIVKSNKYFNSLEIESDIEALTQRHLADVKAIRERFVMAKLNLPTVDKVSIPQQEVSLGGFLNHTRNNIGIEIGTEILEWLLGLLIVFVVQFFVNKITGVFGCLIDIVVAIVILIISVFLSSHNDNKLLDSLRTQNQKEYTLNEKAILESINRNTIQFYDIYK